LSLLRAAVTAFVTATMLAGCTLATTGTAVVSERTGAAPPVTSSPRPSAEPAKPAPATDTHRTIHDYILANGIAETQIRRGDPGPRIDLPVPPGWQITDRFDEMAPYEAIVYDDPAVPSNPPRILSFLSKLDGGADPDQILALAPGEVHNLPGFDGPAQGITDSLSGFDAVRIGGGYDNHGTRGVVAQKTVVIPGRDGLFVLQFNAVAAEPELAVIAEATSVVDEQTTITP